MKNITHTNQSLTSVKIPENGVFLQRRWAYPMSLDDAISDLHKAHQAAQEKYTYFLLAAAGAAIGFAIQKTEGLTLSWWLLPVALATICWGISFHFGCKNGKTGGQENWGTDHGLFHGYETKLFPKRQTPRWCCVHR